MLPYTFEPGRRQQVDSTCSQPVELKIGWCCRLSLAWPRPLLVQQWMPAARCSTMKLVSACK